MPNNVDTENASIEHSLPALLLCIYIPVYVLPYLPCALNRTKTICAFLVQIGVAGTDNRVVSRSAYICAHRSTMNAFTASFAGGSKSFGKLSLHITLSASGYWKDRRS